MPRPQAHDGRPQSAVAEARVAVMPGCANPIKTVVVIGNGPSALTLSYLLSGHVPFYSGGCDDVALHARLSHEPHEPLVTQDLQQLATGCEGRSTNPVAVMFDSLSHPDADLGVERPSLLSWRHRPDLAVDHVVLGKGKPGAAGSMDGTIQTVSLGNWMELPDMPLGEAFKVDCDNRVPVAAVANYYEAYVANKNLKSFSNFATVTSVREMGECAASCLLAKRDANSAPNFRILKTNPEEEDIEQPDVNSVAEEVNALFENETLLSLEHTMAESSLSARTNRLSCSSEGDGDSAFFSSPLASTPTLSACSAFSQANGCSNPSDEENVKSVTVSSTLGTTPFGQQIQWNYHEHLQKKEARCCSLLPECANANDVGFSDVFNGLDLCCSWDPIVNPKLFCPSGVSCSSSSTPRSRSSSWSSFTCRQSMSRFNSNSSRLFEVRGFINSNSEKKPFKYFAKNIVLATGSFDLPNALKVEGEDLPFVFHSLQQLEALLAQGELGATSDPVLIVGAGLSAADAILTLEKMGVPVVHALRRHSDSSIFKKLPAKLYPEYHRVFRLMCGDADVKQGTYTALQGCHVMEIVQSKKVLLHVGSEQVRLDVSCVVILIGASPDLGFLDPKLLDNLGILKNVAIGRNNPVDIDLFTNEAVEVPGIYAMGPLVGDNFVRFLQGGALAIAGDILKKERRRLAP